MTFAVYVTAGAIFSVVLVSWFRSGSGSKLPLPPGPTKLPVIKNLLDIPLGEQWITFTRWSTEYKSDILHAEAVGRSLIILNSYEAMSDLLEKRSAIYSSRASSQVISDMIGWKWLVALMPYDDTWKKSRRLLVKHINPADTSLHKVHETEHLHIFLKHLLDEPEDFLKHARQMVGATTIAMAYGIKIQEKNDPHVELAESAIADLSQASLPGNFLVDTFPWLQYIPEGFPGTGWKERIRAMQAQMEEFRCKPYQAALEALASGTSTDSFVSRCHQVINEDSLVQDQDFIRDVAGIIYAAGNETIISVLGTFFLAIVCFPDAYKKAQAEVDQVLKGRLSEDSDMDSLPYLNALLKEVLRWQVVLPLGVFRAVTRDDEYKGYHIPANSFIVPNVWAIFYNPELFPEPDKFRPERFIKDGKLHVSGLDPSPISFGFGRRTCIGRHIAESTMFHFAASVLSLFDVTKALDDNGVPIEPSREYTVGLTRHPLPFKCSIKPRSRAAEELIRSLSR